MLPRYPLPVTRYCAHLDPLPLVANLWSDLQVGYGFIASFL